MQISTISPSTFDDGKPVTLTGSGFGASQGQVLIGGVAQNVNTWSDDEITFTTVRGSQSLGACRVDVVRGSTDWQLASGHWVPARMAMTAIHPHESAGTNAQHLWAHPSMEYRQPICVQGGAWPFYYALIAAPSGATISNFLAWNPTTNTYDVPDDYGVVQWTPSSGTHAFTVRVTDQDGSALDVSWSVTVDATKFVFVDSAASGGGSGTISSPFTWAECFGTLSTTTNNAQKIAVFRGGTITCTGFSDTNGNLSLNGDLKPKAWLGFPGETPILDFNSTMKILFNASAAGAMNDSAFVGLRFRNARQDVNNGHYIWASTLFHRHLVWRNYFESLGKGLVGNDNPACVFYSSAGSATNPRTYYAICQNTFDGMLAGGGNGVAATDSYNVRYGLWEHNTYKNSQSNYLAWRKGGHQYTTVRRNVAVENNTGSGPGLFNDYGSSDGSSMNWENNEFCWNKGIQTTGVYDLNGVGAAASDNLSMSVYRNTLKGTMRSLSAGRSSVTALNNLVTETSWPTWHTANTDVAITGSDIDANGNLTGSSRASYLGTHGAEVA